ncbi:MAG: S16 family serine protease [Actinomycetota bacterium]
MSRAQAQQDAWVASWAGWQQEHPPGRPPPVRPIPPAATTADRATAPWSSDPPTNLRRWLAGGLAAVVAIGIASGLFIEVPYVALVPGTARDTEPLLEVAGVDEYPSDGEVLFTTVRVRQRPNVWEYLWLGFDDDATVVPEEDILGDRTPEQNRQFNLSLMSDSKQVAVAVALEQLGYDAITTDGVVVHRLVPETPAEAVLELGDTIVAIDGQTTAATGALVEILAAQAPGDEIELTVEDLTSGESEIVVVALAENPDNPGAGFLGIEPADRVRYGTGLDFTVEIDSGSVGGPSAGLAFTLAVLDQLTEGELTGGAQVAVTGTIQADGSVGRVGGVLQKTAAVRDLGVDVFIVPASLGEQELEAIMGRAGDDLTIVPVNNLDEALTALGELGGDVGAVEEFASLNVDASG